MPSPPLSAGWTTFDIFQTLENANKKQHHKESISVHQIAT